LDIKYKCSVKVWFFTPYSTSKNLGAEYNAYLDMIPDGDAACLQDGDSMMLVPDWGHIIQEYANRHYNAVLTCWVSRLHELAKGQLMTVSDDVRACIEAAKELKQFGYGVTPITGSVSGTLLVVPKHIWKKHPFSEVNTFRPGEPNLLGCDNAFTNEIRRAGIQVLRMNSILIYHQYRILSNGKDKSHLL
jgi:hypothetical protein